MFAAPGREGVSEVQIVCSRDCQFWKVREHLNKEQAMLRKLTLIAVAVFTLACQFGCSGIHDILIHANQIIQLLGALDQLGLGVI